MAADVGTGATNIIKELLTPKSKVIVQFRPHSDYKGEYGFDWLRVKDNGLSMEPDYESIIVSGYKNETTDYTKQEAYNALKREYKQIPFIVGFFGTYYIPYLNLFPKTYSDTIKITPKPPYEAKLKILVEIKHADVDEIKFEFNKDIFSINDKTEFALSDKNICPLKVSTTIKVTCKKDITTDADGEILVYAYPKGSKNKPEAEQKAERKLAGKLIVGKNDATNRKEAKFVFVCVKTNVTGTATGVKTGFFSENEQAQLRQTLYQALIRPLIWVRRKNLQGQYQNIMLDMTNDPKFKMGGTYIHSSGFAQKGPISDSMVKYLKSKFMNNPNNKQYLDCIPIFVIGLPGTGGLLGYCDSERDTSGNIIRFINNSVAFTPSSGNRPVETMPHEALHGLQLFHTHRDGSPPLKYRNIKYIYPHGQRDIPNATDNVMSYRIGNMRTLWHWQWKIIKNNL